jgi:hypothetical protein
MVEKQRYGQHLRVAKEVKEVSNYPFIPDPFDPTVLGTNL